MALAYRCDKCKELFEGYSKKYPCVLIHERIFSHMDLEFCPGCNGMYSGLIKQHASDIAVWLHQRDSING